MPRSAATTVDRLSGGRLVLGIGAGYLRGEFEALGIRFEERRDGFEGAVAALVTAWSGAAVVATEHGPVETVLRPRPPLWVGGNSRRSRRVAARYGAGWAPLLVEGGLAGELGTVGIGSVTWLRGAVAELRELTAVEGRDPAAIDVLVKGAFSRVRAGSTFSGMLTPSTSRPSRERCALSYIRWLPPALVCSTFHGTVPT